MEAKNIVINKEGKIEKIIVNSIEVKSLDDLLWKVKEILDFEKEHNISCTLESINILLE